MLSLVPADEVESLEERRLDESLVSLWCRRSTVVHGEGSIAVLIVCNGAVLWMSCGDFLPGGFVLLLLFMLMFLFFLVVNELFVADFGVFTAALVSGCTTSAFSGFAGASVFALCGNFGGAGSFETLTGGFFCCLIAETGSLGRKKFFLLSVLFFVITASRGVLISVFFRFLIGAMVARRTAVKLVLMLL